MKLLLFFTWGWVLSMFLRTTKQKWMLAVSVFCMSGLLSVTELPQGPQTWVYRGWFYSMDWFVGPLVIFTCWLMPMVLMAFWPLLSDPGKKPLLLLSVVFILYLFLTAAFSTTNFLWFFVCFEGTLLPTGYMIVKWGESPERRLAFKYLFAYGVIGGLPLLVGTCWLVAFYPDMWVHSISAYERFPWEFQLFLLLPGMMKMPMWPFHVWLPKAHVEAPLGGSLLLAGILLKLGGYQILLYKKELQLMSVKVCVLMAVLSLGGALYSSCVCLRQIDIKAAIAYSSVCHMGMVGATLAYWHQSSGGMALSMMLAHGFISCSLFSIASVLADAVGSRSLLYISGMSRIYPSVGGLLLFALALNSGFPLSAGFLSEMFLLTQSVSVKCLMLFPQSLSMVLMGIFGAHLYLETQHGSPSRATPVVKKVRSREYFLMAVPLVGAVLTMTLGDVLF